MTIKPSQTVEERVADSIRESELREAAEDGCVEEDLLVEISSERY